MFEKFLKVVISNEYTCKHVSWWNAVIGWKMCLRYKVLCKFIQTMIPYDWLMKLRPVILYK